MRQDYANGADWAARVPADRAHDLAELERHVIEGARFTMDQADRRAHPWVYEQPTGSNRSRRRSRLAGWLAVLGLAGPLLGAVVYWNRGDAAVYSFDLRYETAVIISGVGFFWGCAFWFTVHRAYSRGNEQRDRAGIALAVVHILLSAIALAAAYSRSETTAVVATFTLIPPWACALMGLWYLLRPRGRAKRATAGGDEAAPLPRCGPSAGDIAEFPEDSRRAVFEDRRQALLILVRRHILDEAEIDDLSPRTALEQRASRTLPEMTPVAASSRPM